MQHPLLQDAWWRGENPDPARLRQLPADLLALLPTDPHRDAALLFLLTDFSYVEARLKADAGNTWPLEADYEQAVAALPPGDEREVLAAFGEAVRLESHALRVDPANCYAQLYNRLRRDDGGLVDRALEGGAGAPARPWLRATKPLPRPHPALHRTLAGHTDEVLGVGISADGRRAVSGGRDAALRAWDLAGGAHSPALLAFQGYIHCLALSADGRRALAGGDDGLLRVWNLADDLSTMTNKDQPRWTLASLYGGNGHTPVAAQPRGQVRVWYLEQGKLIRSDNKFGRVFVRTTLQETVLKDKSMSEARLAQAYRFSGRTQHINALAMTPDGRFAVATHEVENMGVWDVERGRALALLLRHEKWIDGVAITPDGKRVVSVSWDKTLRIWDLQEPIVKRVLSGHPDLPVSVAVTADGRRAVTTCRDETLRVWDLEQEQQVSQMAVADGWKLPLAITPDGSRVLSLLPRDTPRLRDLATGELLGLLGVHPDSIYTLAMTPDLRWALTGDSRGYVRLWNLGKMTGTPEVSGRSMTLVIALTPDRRYVVGRGVDGLLQLWDLEMAEPPQVIAQHGAWSFALAMTADHQRIYVGTRTGEVFEWDLSRQGPPRVIIAHAEVVKLPPAPRHNPLGIRDQPEVVKVAVTPDGRRLVTTGHDWTLRVWDLDAPSGYDKPALIFDDNRQTSWGLAVTPDGRHALTSGGDNTVSFWRLAADATPTILEGHSNWVGALDITPDARWGISGAKDRTVRVWDLEQGRAIAVLEGHGNDVETVSIAADGRRALSGSRDGTLRLWDVETSAEIARYTWDSPIINCRMEPDGSVTMADGLAHILCFELQIPAR